jgi:hypothetical protein
MEHTQERIVAPRLRSRLGVLLLDGVVLLVTVQGTPEKNDWLVSGPYHDSCLWVACDTEPAAAGSWMGVPKSVFPLRVVTK